MHIVGNKDPEVSVVVANYNGLHFLPTLIDSFLNQSFKDFEVIFVDDGSTDNSVDFIKQFVKQLDIKIVQHEHLGVGAAKASGVARASGRFLMFADSDDYFEHEFIGMYYERIISSDANLLFFPIYSDVGEDVRVVPLPEIKSDSASLVSSLLSYELQGWLVQTISYASIWNVNPFVDGVNYAEDLTALVVILRQKDVRVELCSNGRPQYHYVRNEKSITVSTSLKTLQSKLNSAVSLKKYFIHQTHLMDKFIADIFISVAKESVQLSDRRSRNLIRKQAVKMLDGLPVSPLSKIRARLGLYYLKKRLLLRFKEKNNT